MTGRTTAIAVGAALALSGLVLGVVRVVTLETDELEHRAGPIRIERLRQTDPNRTEQTVRLTEVELRRGDRFRVELCATSRAPDAVWEGGLHAVAWMPDGETLLFRTPIGRRLGERRRGARRCWTVGLGTVPRTGAVALEAFWPDAAPRPEIAAADLDVRVSSYALPVGLDRVAVVLLALGALLAVMAAAIGRRGPAPTGTPGDALGVGAAAIALVLLALAELGSGLVSGGAVGLVASGLALAIAQVAIAWAIARRGGGGVTRTRLALFDPPRFGLWLAVVVATLAAAVALWVPGLWPARGVAPLEIAISWPSGKLAVALVALVVPVAEEVFFRGLVFGALRDRLGTAGAVLGSAAVFVLAHVPQDLGNPGALVAVGITGLLLGSLRAVTGSLWPCALAHVGYNAALVAAAWW